MSDILTRICEDKRAHVAAAKAGRSITELAKAAKSVEPPREFTKRLQRSICAGEYGLIAEIKRASPSYGLIREDFDPGALAMAYRRGGASCLSVLTDNPYFQGRDKHLSEVSVTVNLPILRKDFMLDPYQIVESRALGADCVLLIMAALDDGQAAELESVARDYGMDVLVEVHDGDELERALKLETILIGINNRNLKTLEVDIAVTEQLAVRIPADRITVSESGLCGPADLERISRAGVNCFLVGELLMREVDVEAATRTLLLASRGSDG